LWQRAVFTATSKYPAPANPVTPPYGTRRPIHGELEKSPSWPFPKTLSEMRFQLSLIFGHLGG